MLYWSMEILFSVGYIVFQVNSSWFIFFKKKIVFFFLLLCIDMLYKQYNDDHKLEDSQVSKYTFFLLLFLAF